MFRFSHTDLKGAREAPEVGAPLGPERAWSERRLLLGEKAVSANFPTALAFERTGGCPVAWRATLGLLIQLKLTGIAVAAALFIPAASTTERARSCALSASICLVASYFYRLIYKVRSQHGVYGPSMLAVLRPRRVAEAATQAGEDDAGASVHARLAVQEDAVDSLRSTDWTVTLVLIAIEHWFLASDIAPTRTPFLGVITMAVLQPLVVQLGLLPKFYFSNFRRPKGTSVPAWQTVLGITLFAVATALWALTTASHLDQIGPLSNLTGYDRSDAEALVIISAAQVVYPLTALLDVIYMLAVRETYAYTEYSPWLSAIKDVLFGSADLATKGGLCLIAFLRATRP